MTEFEMEANAGDRFSGNSLFIWPRVSLLQYSKVLGRSLNLALNSFSKA